MTTIQSVNVPLWLSADGVIYKQLVCIENYTLKITTNTNKTITFCGIAIGVGIVEFDISYSAVCEVIPTASQVTSKDLYNWQLAGTILWMKIQFPSPGSAGTNLGLAGQVYPTDMSIPIAVNTAVKFSGTLTGTGPLNTF